MHRRPLWPRLVFNLIESSFRASRTEQRFFRLIGFGHRRGSESLSSSTSSVGLARPRSPPACSLRAEGDDSKDREELIELHAALETVLARPPVTTATPEADRIEPEAEASHPRWIRPIGDYERRETTIVEGLRYG